MWGWRRLLQYLIQDQDVVDVAGTHVVSKIKGTCAETFAHIDKDGDGSIDASELGILLAEMNDGKPARRPHNHHRRRHHVCHQQHHLLFHRPPSLAPGA